MEQLNDFFLSIPDKQQAWNDLHKSTTDKNSHIRSDVAFTLGRVFPQIPNKQQAWDDLIKLTSDKDHNVRYQASSALDSAFPQMPNKELTWNDLHELTNHKDYSVRSNAANALCSAFSQIPNKQQAWDDLHRLANDEESSVRFYVASGFGSVFSHVPDILQACSDLHRLTKDEDSGVRSNTASTLDSVFSHGPDKQQAWDDLHRLIYDEDWQVRFRASFTLGSVFSHVPDKQQAWDDIHRLTYDENNCVRSGATFSIGSAFTQVPDRKQALNDLYRLTKDEYRSVRTFANNSLGKVSIFKASKAENEEDYKKELENAIEFFERSINISYDKWYSQPKFCLLFYRSFHTIIFKRLEAKEEVKRYLEEVKSEIEGSKSKELLFEAVKNLAEALNEVQKLENLDLETKKGELNFYRKYCDHAAELMKNTDEKAPFATEVLRKGMPILDRRLKEILEEIQEKAKTACQISKRTATQEIACAVNKEIQKWEIGSQEEMNWYVEHLIFTLEASIPKEIENKAIFDKIKQIREEKILVKQYAILCSIIPMIPNLHVKHAISGLEKEVHQIKETVENLTISLKPGLKQEIEISSGIEIWGTGAKLITTIPLQEISYPEIMKDLECIKEKNIVTIQPG